MYNVMSLSLQTFCSFPRAVDASNNLLLISPLESFDGVSVTPRYLNRLTWSRDVSSSLMLYNLKLIFMGEYHSFSFWYADLHPVFLADIYSFDQGL